ncbi:MAG: apolipoprotein N-acyltransferase [Terriglobia bacterium]
MSRLIFKPPLFRLAASILSGILLVLVFPLPNLPLLVWIACIPLILAVITERRLGLAFLWGLVTGAVFLTGSLYWFVGVMENYGSLTLFEASAAMLLFLALFTPFWGVFALLEAWVARRSRRLALLLSPFLWVALELARTYLFTGFPWNLLGYAVAAKGLEQIASVTAVYGLSFLTVATSALLCWVLVEPRLGAARVTTVIWIVFLLVLNFALGPPPVSKGRHLAVLIQPNVPLTEAAVEAWAPWRNPGPLRNLVNLSVKTIREHERKGSEPPLIVWPENSAPFFFNRDPIFRGAVETMARQAHAYVVVNTVTFIGSGTSRPQNTAVMLNPAGNVILEYHKIHLVPMGEYVPGWLHFTHMGKITSEVGDFVPGAGYNVAETPEGGFGIFICYEAIFPQLVRHLTPPGPGVLVNISDDAWYGKSAARFQHLNMARFRAIENRRYLLRATNDGITAVVDPYGREVAIAPPYRQTELTADFDFIAHRTFYTDHGDVFAWACVVATLIILGAGIALGLRFRGNDGGAARRTIA